MSQKRFSRRARSSLAACLCDSSVVDAAVLKAHVRMHLESVYVLNKRWTDGQKDAACVVLRTLSASGSAPVVLGRVSPTWYFLDTRMGLQLQAWAMDGRGVSLHAWIQTQPGGRRGGGVETPHTSVTEQPAITHFSFLAM